MTVSHAEFQRKLLKEFLDMAETMSRPHVMEASFQLSQSMVQLIESDTEGRLHIPHYWALYLHEGRGVVTPKKARLLVWFRNIYNDPRIRGGIYPKRLSQVRRLTKSQWKFWNRENYLARKRGVPEPMIVRRWSGPAQGKKFWGNEAGQGMYGFDVMAGTTAKRLMSQHVKQYMGSLLNVRGTVTVDL